MNDTIQRRFERFHKTNPQVLAKLEKLAEQWFAAGHDKVAIGMLWEALRWQEGVSTVSEDSYRLNDHYRSRYVRLLIERRPEWADRFALRELRAA